MTLLAQTLLLSVIPTGVTRHFLARRSLARRVTKRRDPGLTHAPLPSMEQSHETNPAPAAITKGAS
jgi:hypothetical protein